MSPCLSPVHLARRRRTPGALYRPHVSEGVGNTCQMSDECICGVHFKARACVYFSRVLRPDDWAMNCVCDAFPFLHDKEDRGEDGNDNVSCLCSCRMVMGSGWMEGKGDRLKRSSEQRPLISQGWEARPRGASSVSQGLRGVGRG